MQSSQRPSQSELSDRRRAMAAFAAATPGELAAAIDAEFVDRARDLRTAEAGLIMLRGRIGGDGGAFNLGEATVARASVRIDGVGVGHGYRLGRDVTAARLGAIADALWQAEATRAMIERRLIEPVEQRLAAEADTASRRAAATRVDFFTMVRGED